ncbi:uncharacterized protein LOC126587809 [Malus sylvestris]|uniref:uncharacterized protein LOC126587809 n=1 Tax=Malus sylvestris TaxID=3752 RepID=UPI0021ABD9CA|nr:uncharacterized protein LOC126587809 [Malus sylvestris]
MAREQWSYSICYAQSSPPCSLPSLSPSLPQPPFPQSHLPLLFTRRLFLFLFQRPLRRYRLARAPPVLFTTLFAMQSTTRSLTWTTRRNLSPTTSPPRKLAALPAPTAELSLLLTIPQSVGYEQNPLSLYYCYDLVTSF